VKKTAITKAKDKTGQRYVESHWLVFILKGIVTLLAGAFIMFTSSDDVPRLVTFIGCVLIGLAIVEIGNIFYRRIRQRSWGIPLVVAIFEAAVGIAMIMLSKESHVVHIALLAGYALVRGVTSIIIGFVSFSNSINRFLWVACGMACSVIAFVIFADQGLSETTFIKIFGTFLMILGLTDIFFGINSRDELKALKSGKKSKK
jgi:uncharacterized membrane protein HdeD (DUF308 family)